MTLAAGVTRIVLSTGIILSPGVGGYLITKNPGAAAPTTGCPLSTNPSGWECRTTDECAAGYVCTAIINPQQAHRTQALTPAFGHCIDPFGTCDAGPAIQADWDALPDGQPQDNGNTYFFPANSILKIGSAAAYAGGATTATGCAMTAGGAGPTYSIICDANSFLSLDYGAAVTVPGAGPAGAPLVTRLKGLEGTATNPNYAKQAFLTDAASTTVSGVTMTWNRMNIGLRMKRRMDIQGQNAVLSCTQSVFNATNPGGACLMTDTVIVGPTLSAGYNANFSHVRNLTIQIPSATANHAIGWFIGASGTRGDDMRINGFGRGLYINGVGEVYESNYCRFRNFYFGPEWGYSIYAHGADDNQTVLNSMQMAAVGGRDDSFLGNHYYDWSCENCTNLTNDIEGDGAALSMHFGMGAHGMVLGGYIELDSPGFTDTGGLTSTIYLGGNQLAYNRGTSNVQRLGYGRSHLIVADDPSGLNLFLGGLTSAGATGDYYLAFQAKNTAYGPVADPGLLKFTRRNGESGFATEGETARLILGFRNQPSLGYAAAACSTNQSLTGAATCDGTVLSTGNIAFLFGQSAPAENGPWTVNTAGAWTRPTNFDAAGDLFQYMLEGVATGGTIYGGQTFTLTTAGPYTFGTTGLTWQNIGRTGNAFAGSATTNPTGGSNYGGFKSIAVAVDPGSVAASSVLTFTFGCPGAKTNDPAFCSPRTSLTAGVIYTRTRVSANDICEGEVANLTTGGAIDPAAFTLDCNAWRP